MNEHQVVDHCAAVIWDYLKLNQPLEQVDCILVFGGHDPTVAQHAARLYLANWASFIIVSGGAIHPPHFYGNTQPMIEADAFPSGRAVPCAIDHQPHALAVCFQMIDYHPSLSNTLNRLEAIQSEA